MKLTVLGSGTSVPDPVRGPAGLLLELDHRAWLVDGGSGTLQRCARAGVDPRRLTGGVYSHRHPDHTGDLVPLLFAMRVGPPPRQAPYPIAAGEGFEAFFEALEATYGKWLRPPGGVQITELSLQAEARLALSESLDLVTRPANHSAGALHLRFESPTSSVVFSGDTGPSEELVTLARGASLLVCECAGSDAEPVPGHLTPSEVAHLVAEARPEAVWLTHLYPHVDPEEAVRTVARTGVSTRHASDGDTWLAPPRR